MMSMLKMTELPLAGKRVLIREDFNVPLDSHGQVVSDARILAALNTLELARNAGAKIIVMSHLGRPTEGEFKKEFSLKPIAEKLSKYLTQPVRLESNWIDGVEVEEGEIVLCENVRFLEGEKSNSELLARKMAALCDIFVMDAFGVAHRKQASTYGVAQFADIACAGPLFAAEIEAIQRALEHPNHPVVTIIGGSKVSTKLKLLEALAKISDAIIVGGGIANTFLAAQDFPIGRSLYEANLLANTKQLLAKPGEALKFAMPIDVIVGQEFSASTPATIKSITDVEKDDLIMDVGPKTQERYCELLLSAKTIIWNGPVGVFEFPAFAQGTESLAHAIAKSAAFTIAGGGDTVAAIEKFNVADEISYISTGGGAFLAFLEGEKLPSVAILEQRAILNKK